MKVKVKNLRMLDGKLGLRHCYLGGSRLLRLWCLRDPDEWEKYERDGRAGKRRERESPGERVRDWRF